MVGRTLLATLALLLAGAPALAGDGAIRPGHSEEATAVQRTAAARVLSAYVPGRMPVEGPALRAIADLDVYGEPEDIAVLRHVLDHESDVLARMAKDAIGRIRARQRVRQRDAFKAGLSTPDPTLNRALTRAERWWMAGGLGPTEAWCAAYADVILGEAGDEPSLPSILPDDPKILLARGEAASALAATDGSTDAQTRVRAFEDAGRVRGAIRIHAEQAASGDAEAIEALESYGIEVERLVLGLLHQDQNRESETLETLVRSGRGLTVRVLAERVVDPPSASDQVTAADALGRMLHTQARRDPLPRADRERIRTALRTASFRAAPAVRPIVREALRGEAEE